MLRGIRGIRKCSIDLGDERRRKGVSENETEVKTANRNVVVLGWVAFFGGLSQDMIQPILL